MSIQTPFGRLGVDPFQGPASEIYAQVRLTTRGGTLIPLEGFDQLSMRLNMGSADEMTLSMPAQNQDGTWKADLPVWQVGSLISVAIGYDGNYKTFQEFEVVSTTNTYDDGDGGEMMTVRGVSELARAARNQEPRVFPGDPGDDLAIISKICEEYGWTNGVESNNLRNDPNRAKEAGKSDLDLLNQISKQAKLGGPRVTRDRVFCMPSPILGEMRFNRGGTDPGARRLHSLSAERDGNTKTRVIIIAWNPAINDWVQTEFEADEFFQSPKIIWEGPRSQRELPFTPGEDAKTQTLTLALVEHSGTGKKERVDVINVSQYRTELSIQELAKRFFEVREKLTRWATAVVDGHIDVVPYVSIKLGGNLAKMDSGHWIPIYCDHIIDSNGWTVSCRVIRVNDEVGSVAVQKV